VAYCNPTTTAFVLQLYYYSLYDSFIYWGIITVVYIAGCLYATPLYYYYYYYYYSTVVVAYWHNFELVTFFEPCPSILLLYPLSSTIVLPMMKLSNSIHYFRIWADDPKLMSNLASLLAASIVPCSLFWCLDAPSSWSNDARHVSEAFFKPFPLLTSPSSLLLLSLFYSLLSSSLQHYCTSLLLVLAAALL